jgi:hypothetical protein
VGTAPNGILEFSGLVGLHRAGGVAFGSPHPETLAMDRGTAARTRQVTLKNEKFIMTRTQKEIDREILKFQWFLTVPRWNQWAREGLVAVLKVLTDCMTAEQVELKFYEDETTEDYREGDNDLWVQADRAACWLAGEPGYPVPSEGVL